MVFYFYFSQKSQNIFLHILIYAENDIESHRNIQNINYIAQNMPKIRKYMFFKLLNNKIISFKKIKFAKITVVCCFVWQYLNFMLRATQPN